MKKKINSVSAEQVLIGAILNRNEEALSLIGQIHPDYCKEQKHKDILSVLCDMQPDDINIVAVTLELLTDPSKVREVGGMEYLVALMDAAEDSEVEPQTCWRLIEAKHNVAQYVNEAKDNEDSVNHPSHYTWLKDVCGVESIDICEQLGFNLGNAAKYILRAGHKHEEGMTDNEKRVQDLKKAAWYINREINNIAE